MNMVFNASDVVEHTLLGADDPADERIETLAEVGGDPWRAVLGGEDNVEEQGVVGAGLRRAPDVGPLLRPCRGGAE